MTDGDRTVDYRDTHLERGPTYDRRIENSPFDAFMARWEARHVEDILRARFPSGVGRHLDFACGTGRITAVVAPFARETVGLDISPTMLEEARLKVPAARFVQGDVTSQSLDIGRFDLITSFRFFGNAQDDLRIAVLRALRERLEPGGLLLINNHRNPMSAAALLGWIGTKKARPTLTYFHLRHLLEQNGFRIEERRPIGAWMYRAAVMNAKDRTVEDEQRLERTFGAHFLATVAPDAVIVARRVG